MGFPFTTYRGSSSSAKKGIRQGRISHSFPAISETFDDPNLVSCPCVFRLAVAQVRLSGEQVVQGCLHGVVVQVGVVERAVRGVCQASRSGGEGDVQTLATWRRAGAFTRASAAS